MEKHSLKTSTSKKRKGRNHSMKCSTRNNPVKRSRRKEQETDGYCQEPVHNKSSDGHGAGDYGDDFMQEEESFARSAAQIGLPTNICDAIEAVITGKVNESSIPDPAEAAVREVLSHSSSKVLENMKKCIISGNLGESGHCPSDEDQDSDDADSTDDELGKTAIDIYLEAGFNCEEKGSVLPKIDEEEKPVLVDILTALTAAKDGYNLLANSARLLERAVLRAPNLKSLSKILSSATSFNPDAVTAAKSRKHERQTVKFSLPLEYKPKRTVDGKFNCRICKFRAGSWSGMDSHIRKDHSKIFYGPCGDECTFSTPNIDSWRRHCQQCKFVAKI